MELIRQTPGSQRELVNATISQVPATNPGFITPEVEDQGGISDTWDAAKAAFQRENTLISLAQGLGAEGSAEYQEQVDRLRSFNPFQLMLDDEEMGEEFINSYTDAIDAGVFDLALTKEDILSAAQRWDFQKGLVEDMEKSFVGSLAGGLATALVDPTSYVPVTGGLGKLTAMGRLARLAVHGTTSAALSEAVLQSTQDLRSLEESILNIGTSGLISSGIGAAGELAKLRTHPLHKDHPNNPLRRENLDAEDMVIRTVGEEDVVLSRGSTAGAAQVEDTVMAGPGLDIERADAKSGVGRATLAVVDALQRAGGWGSLVAKAFSRRGTLARRYAFRMFDTGGIYTKANEQGVATSRSAEVIANDHRRIAQRLFDESDARFRQLTKDLTLGLRKPFQTWRLNRDWQDMTRRILRGIEEIDDTLQRELRARYGEKGAETIKAAAHEYAESVHRANDYFRQNLIKQGFLRDNAKFEKLQNDLAALEKKRDAAREEARLQAALAEKGDDIGPVRAERKEKVDALNEDIKRTRAALDVEKAKPQDLGRDYGLAQVWNREAISLYPEEFKNFLRSVIAKNPDEDWLAEEFKITKAELEDLRVTDPDRYKEIIEQWSGDEWLHRVVRAEAELKAAQRLREDADNELSYTLQLLGMTRREEVTADLSLARKKRDHLAGERDALRKRRAQLKAEQRAIKDAATAARTRTLARQQQGIEDAPEAGAREFEELVNARSKEVAAGARAERAQLELDADSYAQPNAAAVGQGKLASAIAGERAAETATSKASAAQARIEDGIEAPAAPDVETTPTLAKAEQRARDMAEELGRIDAEVRVAEEKLVKLDAALKKAEQRKSSVKRLKEDLKIARKEAKANSKVAGSLASKADAELQAAYKKLPMETTIENIYRALASGKEVPAGVLDERMPMSGRLKARQLHLTPEERLRAEQRLDDSGRTFLNTNLSHTLQSQYDHLSGQLAIREALGGKSWEDMELDIRREYDELKEAAKDAKERDSLRREEADALEDLRLARDRILHNEGDEDGWLPWLSRNARLYTLARFGAGFMVSSLTDAGALALRHPILESAKRFRQVMSAMSQAPGSELTAIIHATEVGSHSMFSASRTAASRFGDEDLWRTGNPAKSPTGQKIAGGVDHTMRFLANASIWAGGLRLWTRYTKATAAVVMSYRVRDLVGRYDSLKPGEMADLASTGIGRKEAARIDAMMKKHGTENSQGWFEPNLELWDDLEAARTFRIALQRDMNRSVVTPGVGDPPRLMSKWAGRFFMQFWSHPIAFTNRFVVPAVQRGIMDPRVGIALATLMTSSVAVTMMKEAAKGRDPFEKLDKEPASFVAEAFDRSGILGYFSQYAMTAGKLTGLWESSRYERSSAFSNLLGVNAGLVENVLDVGDTAGAALAGDKNASDVGKKLNKLRPFAFLADVSEAFLTN